MARIALASSENLTPEQQRVHDAIVGARGGKLPGPYRTTLLHSAVITDKWQQLGDALRKQIMFEPRLAELAIIVTAHYWDCRFVWSAHAPQAIKGGLDEALVEAMRAGRRPAFAKADEEAIYAFCSELLRSHAVGEACYQRALTLFGPRGTVELTALIGYYTMVCMALKAHDYPVPEQAALLQPLS
jgi:4-carboxymuconolactone decarboxylase